MITIMIGCKPDNLNQMLSYHAVIVYSSQTKTKNTNIVLTFFYTTLYIYERKS